MIRMQLFVPYHLHDACMCHAGGLFVCVHVYITPGGIYWFKPTNRWVYCQNNGAQFTGGCIVGPRPPPPPVVPTFFLLFSFTFLFEDFYYIVWKNIRKSVFVAVQDSCNYAGTKLCLNDHYLCETFCLGWTIHHCNATPMWGLISLLALIEHLSQLAWMPT